MEDKAETRLLECRTQLCKLLQDCIRSPANWTSALYQYFCTNNFFVMFGTGRVLDACMYLLCVYEVLNALLNAL